MKYPQQESPNNFEFDLENKLNWSTKNTWTLTFKTWLIWKMLGFLICSSFRNIRHVKLRPFDPLKATETTDSWHSKIWKWWPRVILQLKHSEQFNEFWSFKKIQIGSLKLLKSNFQSHLSKTWEFTMEQTEHGIWKWWGTVFEQAEFGAKVMIWVCLMVHLDKVWWRKFEVLRLGETDWNLGQNGA